jgi:K+-sensing histidine kinase KdpD
VLVAAASGVVALLESSMPHLVGRPLVYLLAVLPVATWWGFGPGAVIAVASVAGFAFLFVRPRGSFAISDVSYGITLVIFLVNGAVVAWQAARSRRNERESARLSQEQAGLRRVATLVAGAARPREVFGSSRCSARCWTSCGRRHGGSTRRCCPRAGWSRPCARWHGALRCRSSST